MAIITRKIKICVNEQDELKRKEFLNEVYEWRYWVRKGANIVSTHKFCQDSITSFVYLNDNTKEKFYVKDCLRDEKGMSEQNTTYRVLSELMKGKVPADIYSCLNQIVANTYKETKKDVLSGNASLRTYRNNIPIPFSAKAIGNIFLKDEVSEKGNKYKAGYFTLFNVPFKLIFGRDRSNNRVMIERCISGEYKICGSSIMIDDDNKIYLLLTIDVPKSDRVLDDERTLVAMLGIDYPITVVYKEKLYNIGTSEEFFHRRRQIQKRLNQLQESCKYNTGGHGRKQRMKALDRYEKLEQNYIQTKLHTYSRMLVDWAIKFGCKNIELYEPEIQPEETEEEEKLVIRNWSYYGLIEKIAYKCNLEGITLKGKCMEKKKKTKKKAVAEVTE